MAKYLIPMDEEYKQKHYPNGFLEGANQGIKSAATAIVVFAVVLILLFTPLIIFGIRVAAKGISGGSSADITSGLIFVGIGLVFVIPAIFGIGYAKKHKRKSVGDLLQDLAKRNHYTESVMQEYVNQVLRSDTYIMRIAGEFAGKNGNTGTGFLTRDFLALAGAVIKREDIIGIYCVNTTDVIGVGNKIKSIKVLKIAICGKNRNAISPVKREAADELISMLTSQTPNIDTKPGIILTEEEFKKIAQELGLVRQ